MQQPATSPRLLSLAAQPPGMLLLSRHQFVGALTIRPSAVQCATAFLLNAGLIPKNGSRFCILRVEAERQGKPVEAAMMPPSRPVPPAPSAAGAAAGTR